MNFENTNEVGSILAAELAQRITVLLNEQLNEKKSEPIVNVPKRPDIKNHVLERDGYRCQWCAISGEEHLKKFGMSLIVCDSDGFRYKQRQCNPDQLITLCSICQARLVTGSRRRGKTA